MFFKRLGCAALAGASLFLGAGGAPAGARSASPQDVMRQIEHGQWLLKEKLGGERRICFTAPVHFIQLVHGSQPCEQFVVSQDEHSTTVHYMCAGHGRGRTTVTVETPRLVRIETQGVLDGAPFEQEFEARRVGNCG